MNEFKYGLMVIDPTIVDEDDCNIVHFVGYLEEPTKEDAKQLREELRDDPEFGLQDMWDKVDIFPAPQEIVDHFLSCYNEDN
jgi:hypothetical protein